MIQVILFLRKLMFMIILTDWNTDYYFVRLPLFFRRFMTPFFKEIIVIPLNLNKK